jgi:hypothetical protein
MPRLLNALVDCTPKLENFSINLTNVAQDAEASIALLSDTFVDKITEFVADSGEEGHPELCLADFSERKTENGTPRFQPDLIHVRWYTTALEDDDSGIWEQVLRTRLNEVYFTYRRSSRLAAGLPKGLQTLNIEELVRHGRRSRGAGKGCRELY